MDYRKTTLRGEIQIIPGWAYVLVLAAFSCFQILLAVVWRHAHNVPPLPVQIFIRVVPGIILALFVLLVGYVNGDAKRRGMNRTLWTLLVIFIPNAIGFILYFLLRQPVAIRCPGCGNIVSPKFNFCPSCKHNLHSTCPGCQHAVNKGDKFCSYCSHELGSAPAGTAS